MRAGKLRRLIVVAVAVAAAALAMFAIGGVAHADVDWSLGPADVLSID